MSNIVESLANQFDKEKRSDVCDACGREMECGPWKVKRFPASLALGLKGKGVIKVEESLDLSELAAEENTTTRPGGETTYTLELVVSEEESGEYVNYIRRKDIWLRICRGKRKALSPGTQIPLHGRTVYMVYNRLEGDEGRRVWLGCPHGLLRPNYTDIFCPEAPGKEGMRIGLLRETARFLAAGGRPSAARPCEDCLVATRKTVASRVVEKALVMQALDEGGKHNCLIEGAWMKEFTKKF